MAVFILTTVARPIYKRDFLNVCSFLPGAFIQFGYQAEHIPEHLRQNHAAELADQEAILVFCEQLPPAAEGQADKFRFYPVRKCRIRATVLVPTGGLLVTLCLGEFFKYDEGGKGQLASFQNALKEVRAREQTAQVQWPFVFRGTDPVPQFWGGNWDLLVAYICKVTGVRDGYFFRTLPYIPPTVSPDNRKWLSRAGRWLVRTVIWPFAWIFAEPGTAGMPQWSWDERTCRPIWVLHGGRSYVWEVQMQHGPEAEVAPLRLVCRNDVITPLGPYDRQHSDGVIVDFILAPKRGFEPEVTPLNLRVDPDPATPNQLRSAEVQAVVKIKAPRWMFVLAAIAIAAGTAVQALDKDTLKELVTTLTDPQAKAWTFVLKGVGLVVTFLGAWFGFKGPSKTTGA